MRIRREISALNQILYDFKGIIPIVFICMQMNSTVGAQSNNQILFLNEKDFRFLEELSAAVMDSSRIYPDQTISVSMTACQSISPERIVMTVRELLRGKKHLPEWFVLGHARGVGMLCHCTG